LLPEDLSILERILADRREFPETQMASRFLKPCRSGRIGMNLLSRRSRLAISAVVDIALHSRPSPVAGKVVAARHRLPPRHLEIMLQGLVHAKILKGVRGPRGGYELARDRRRITLGEIVRTAVSLSIGDPETVGAHSLLMEKVIEPAVRKAGAPFLDNLDSITIEYLCETAEKAHIFEDDNAAADFAI
jgi:Rrf2 family transcriptional regulator, iron-sulfur cluster assembly transcription factor